MTRKVSAVNKIALLATGDELINGDILNTNAQEIARRLFALGMHPGMHLITADTTSDLEQAIHFLLTTHRALIITGGLGPTSDDLTRFALSNATNLPLVFDEPTWDIIVARLKHFGYDSPPVSNRQQALFPKGATIIQNPNGTASGCMLNHNDQLIFMLPGPPMECLPMVTKVVLPTLKDAGFQHIEFYKSWLLFGVSEGQIAEELDNIAKPHDCVTGYRLAYPYIEFKIFSNVQHAFEIVLPQLETNIKPYLIGNGTQTASEQLRNLLPTLNKPIHICDLATGGLLETTLKTPKTFNQLEFTSTVTDHHDILITGLDEFWQSKDVTQTQLSIEFNFSSKQNKVSTTIPFRGDRVKHYAVEFICWKVLDFLTNEFLRPVI